MLKLSQIWPAGAPFKLGLVTFYPSTSLLYGKITQSSIPCTFSAWTLQSFLQAALVSFSEECYLENYDLGARCVHCYWGVFTSRSSLWADLGKIQCVYTHSPAPKYTHTIYTYIYIYLSLSPYILCMYAHLMDIYMNHDTSNNDTSNSDLIWQGSF